MLLAWCSHTSSSRPQSWSVGQLYTVGQKRHTRVTYLPMCTSASETVWGSWKHPLLKQLQSQETTLLGPTLRVTHSPIFRSYAFFSSEVGKWQIMDRVKIRTQSHLFGSALRKLKSRQNQCHSNSSRSLDQIHLLGLPSQCQFKGTSLLKNPFPARGHKC